MSLRTQEGRDLHKVGVLTLATLFGFNPADHELIEQEKRRSFPAAERARRRKANKRARASRRRNRA